MGPASCHDCHATVYWMGDRWSEKHLHDFGQVEYRTHRCTATVPAYVPALYAARS